MTIHDTAELSQLLKEIRPSHTDDAGLHSFLVPVAAYCRKLNLSNKINGLVQSQMHLQPGLLVQTMVLDTLSGRSPLYHLKHFVKNIDSELLLGEEVDAQMFNDTNVGRSLDAIAEYGTGKILTEIGVEAVKQFSLNPRTVSYDTTSTNVWGSYVNYDEKAPGPQITEGYSKDHRPDLKQFMTELLCVDHGVPIFGGTLDGNSSDKDSNHYVLKNISQLMKKHGLGAGAFVYVADSAMVTKKNLSEMGENFFISRLPANFSVCTEIIDKAVEAASWQEIGSLNVIKTGKNSPVTSYKAYEGMVLIDDKNYRAVVIHSDVLDKRRQKKLERELRESQSALEEQTKRVPKRYACEADAKQAAASLHSLKSDLHMLVPKIKTTEVRGRGRPPKNGKAKTVKKYDLTLSIVEREDKVNAKRAKTGCFVLLTNIPEKGDNGLDAKNILQTYKGQYAVEQNFAFLKDPLIVNDLFLKNPARIDALGMILIIALMIHRLMQRMMRRYVQETGKLLPGWKERQDTDRPTTYMLTWELRGINVLIYQGQRFFPEDALNDRQRRYLTGLGLNENVYLNPDFECQPIIPQKHSP